MSNDHAIHAFLIQYLEDQAAGVRRSLDEYQARFPGHAAAIAEHYSRFELDEALGPSLERVGRFRIVRELGRGGQGVVYLAHDDHLHRMVAIKVLTEIGTLATDRVARFVREAGVASRLDHPGIATVYEFGLDGGLPFLAMRYVEGETLANRIAAARKEKGGGEPARSFVVECDAAEGQPVADGVPVSASRTTRREVLRISELIERAARALHEAHEAGIVHRDIKPGNIMLTPKGEPVLLDFGLARDLDAEEQTLTRTGDLFGTPAYMAPEQISAGRVKVDRRADVWALGATLYEALTLTRPFDAPTREGVYQAIQFKDPVRPGRLNPSIPSDLDVVITTALEKDPDRRYHSAEAFAEDLRRAREGEPTLAKPVSLIGRAWRWAKRRPARAALLASLLAVTTLATVLAISLPDLLAQRERKRREAFETCLEDGFFAIFERRPRVAIADFEEALRIEPRDPEAIVGLALAKNRAGDRAGALAVFERPADDAKSHAGLLLAREYVLGSGTDSKAQDSPLPPLQTASDFFLAGVRVQGETWNRADGHAGFKKALRLFDRAVALSPAKRLLYHVHRARAASRALDAAACREIADDLIQLWPSEAYAWYGRALVLHDLDVDERIRAIQRACEMRPKSPLFLHVLGMALNEKGRYEEAEAACRRALQLDPDYFHAWAELGLAVDQQGRLDEAIAAFREIASQLPDNAVGHESLGWALKKKGLYDEAIASYREAVRLAPDRHRAWNGLAIALVKKGRVDEALEAYGEAIRLKPESFEAHNNLGLALMRIGRLDEAISEFETVRRLNPKLIDAHLNLGSCFIDKGRLRDAIAVLREGIHLSPDPRCYYNLGMALGLSGLHDDAVAAFREAIRRKPDAAEPFANLGKTLSALGRYRESLEAYRRAHELGSAQGWREQAEQWVAEAADLVAREEDLEERLAAHLEANTRPELPIDLVQVARVALDKGHAALAAAWFKAGLEESPELAGALVEGHRRHGARAAVLASIGGASAESRPDDATRAGWRLQALAWLEAEAAQLKSAWERGRLSVIDARTAWGQLTQHKDFASVRDADALTKLPSAEAERWTRLWVGLDPFRLAMDSRPESR